MWEIEFTEQLMAASNGECRRVLDKYMQMTGKSAPTLYRIASRHGYASGRKQRCDAGACNVTDQQVAFVSALIQQSAREVKGPIQDVREALEMAEDNGIIDPGQISVSRMQGLLRARGMNAAALRTPDPHIRMRSLHPNHVHVWDASICIQYYLRKGKGLRIMDERDFYKNKPDNFGKIKQKLIRYVLADHFSHCIYLKYYLARGESQDIAYDFITSAWAGDKHPKFPFRGVPFYLLMDAGAANISKAMRAFLERLEIGLPKSMPHNPRRQGSAEVTQNIVESKFESRLRFCPAHTVEDLNAWALDWCVWFNATRKHSRHGKTRTECWLEAKEEQIRDLPEASYLQNLFAMPEVDRTVAGDYTISYDSRTYSVRHIEGVIPNLSKVKVIMRPHARPKIGVAFGDQEYLVEPIEMVAGGFRADAAVIGGEYKRMPDSIVQTAKKTGDNLAFGEERGKNSVPFEGLKVFGHQADKVDRHYMPRKGTPVTIRNSTHLAESIRNKQIPVTTLFKKLISVQGMVAPDLNRAVRERYGKSISVTECDRLMDVARSNGVLTPADLAAATETGETLQAVM